MWFLPLATAVASTLTVGPGGDHTTISAAILAAADGDRIEIAAGTYTEAIRAGGKSLDIVGVSGRSVTFVTPPAAQAAVTATLGEQVFISGLTLRPTAARGADVGSGVVEMDQVAIEDSGTEGSIDGGAVRVRGGTLTLTDCVIRRSAGRRGGALYAYDGGWLDLQGVLIEDATGSFGGAVMVYDADVTVADVQVIEATASNSGGAFHVSGGVLSGSDLVIEDTLGDRTPGAAILLTRDATADLTGGAFRGNTTGSGLTATGGGAVYAEGASLVRLDGTVIEDNDAGFGGAIALAGTSRAELTGVTLRGNTATGVGGGLSLAGATRAVCTQCTVDDNASADGGGVHMTGSASLTVVDGEWSNNVSGADGGAIRAVQGTALELSGASFLNNRASGAGGALSAATIDAPIGITDCLFDGNEATASDGGAIFAGRDTTVVLTDTSLLRNRSVTGGGGAMAWLPVGTPGTLDWERVEATDNSAGTEGGALLARRCGDVTVIDSALRANRSTASGGGVYLDDAASTDSVRTLLAANVSGSFGGGWRERDTVGTCRHRNLIAQENEARFGGGLALTDVPLCDVVNTTFVGNAASDDGGHIHVTGMPVRIINGLFAFAADGGAVFADAAAQVGSDRFYNDVWDNAGGDWVGGWSDPTGLSGNQRALPQLRRLTLDGDWTDDDLHLNIGSPLLDAGAPSILDVDGSISDIGAYGGPEARVQDLDGDGFFDHIDCDDTDRTVRPGAIEVPYDGIDQDCDGEDLVDRDGDGFVASQVGGPDCNDNAAAVHPGAPDTWYDGIDSNCDGRSDFDQDADGYDWDAFGGTDCNDQSPAIHPGANDVPYDGIDSDCDGWSDGDADRDGFDAIDAGGTDCDDFDAGVHPLSIEIPYDGIDQDCNGNDLVDLDLDGFVAVQAGGTDCDDTAANVFPGAADPPYDGLDSNCDGWSDFDADRDGYDAVMVGGLDCNDDDASIAPGLEDVPYDGVDTDCDGWSDFDADRDGYDSDVFSGPDCDDTAVDVFPGAVELPNSRDDDCDGFPEDIDPDADGLTDYEEWALGTDPRNPDSDGDTQPDGKENAEPDERLDTDGDGVIDALDADDDDDGIPSRNEWLVDPDGDGVPETDIDGDLIPNALDEDADGDGMLDELEGERDLDLDGIPDYAWYHGEFGGGGCGRATGNRSMALLLPLLGLLVGGRRRRWLAGLALGAPAALAADGVDSHAMTVHRADGDGLRVEPVAPSEAGTWSAALVTDFARNPLIERRPEGDSPVVRSLLTTDVVVSLAVSDGLRLDAEIPFHPALWDRRSVTPAMGDLRFGARLGLVRPRGARPGLAMVPSFWVPTGTTRRYVGSPTASGGLLFVTGWSAGPASLSFNAGARIAPRRVTRNLGVGFAPLFGASARIDITPGFGIQSELVSQGTTGFSELPIEATGAVRLQSRSGFWVSLGAGAGITNAPGSSRWRGVLAIGRTHSRREAVVLPPPPLPELPVCDFTCPEPEPVPDPTALATLERDRIIVHESIFFYENSAQIRLETSEAVLHAVADIIDAHPEIEHLLIEGHTNDNGGRRYNIGLSQRRAEAVVAWLAARGVDENRLIAKGYGFDRPLVDHDDPLADRANRRVEFTVLRSDEEPDEVRLPTPVELPPE